MHQTDPAKPTIVPYIKPTLKSLPSPHASNRPCKAYQRPMHQTDPAKPTNAPCVNATDLTRKELRQTDPAKPNNAQYIKTDSAKPITTSHTSRNGLDTEGKPTLQSLTTIKLTLHKACKQRPMRMHQRNRLDTEGIQANRPSKACKQRPMQSKLTLPNLTNAPMQSKLTLQNLTNSPMQSKLTLQSLTNSPMQSILTLPNLTNAAGPCNQN